MYSDTIVEVEGVNGEWFTLAGPNEGAEGYHLATDPKGFYDPTVKVVYEEPGNFPGARYLNHRIQRRDITFAVVILNDRVGQSSWISRDSEWRKAWAYDRDTMIHITTQESGHRVLKVRLSEIDVDLEVDPKLGTLTVAKMTVIAGDPFWYEDDVVYSVVTKKDTQFQPTIFSGIFDWDKLPRETMTIVVDPSDGNRGLNPTDQYVWLKWTLPGSQMAVPNLPFPFPPGIPIPWDQAPFTQWVVPDYSFEDPTEADRALKMPGLIMGEDCLVDTDPRVEQVSSASGSQVWARMNGVRFHNAVPPYTKNATFTVQVSGCAKGQMITLRIPRPWTRPWGLEA